MSAQHGTYTLCIDLCNKCADVCDACTLACLNEENAAYMRDCILMDIDCAAFCRLTAGFMVRQSEMLELICEDCAELCNTCAEECEKHPMEHCRLCAEICRKCADTCMRVAIANNY
ncbi:MAG TPA: four-helix bundle copper-binding protein [Methylophilaceae bacterium]|jgi:hypothetical protein